MVVDQVTCRALKGVPPIHPCSSALLGGVTGLLGEHLSGALPFCAHVNVLISLLRLAPAGCLWHSAVSAKLTMRVVCCGVVFHVNFRVSPY